MPTMQKVVIGSLLGFGILTGFFVILAGFITSGEDIENYGLYNSTFNKFTEISSTSTQLADETKTLEQPSVGLFGIIDGLVEATYSTLRLVWNVVTTLTDVILHLSDYKLPIPVWVTSILIASLLVLLTFLFINMWRRWNT